MRLFLLLLAALLGFSSFAQAGDVDVPDQYKAFFADFSAIAKKHPEAAKRFGLFDRDPKSLPALRSDKCPTGMCCDRYSDVGSPDCLGCAICPQ